MYKIHPGHCKWLLPSVSVQPEPSAGHIDDETLPGFALHNLLQAAPSRLSLQHSAGHVPRHLGPNLRGDNTKKKLKKNSNLLNLWLQKNI